MKTFNNILVPVDFTPHSDNALRYAVELAREQPNAQLLIFHAYHAPVAINEVGGQTLMPYYEEEIKKSIMEKFLSREEQLLKGSGIAYEFFGEYGAAVPDLIDKAKKHQSDLIVLPSHPGSPWEEYVGNVTTSVIEQKVAPVLVVPEKARYRKPESIVLATDCKGEERPEQLSFLKALVNKYNACLTLLHSEPNAKDMPQEEALMLLALRDMLIEENPKLELVEAEKPVEGIISYLEKHKADYLVVIPHDHGLFYRLLNKSTTNKLAFKTPVPLLVLV